MILDNDITLKIDLRLLKKENIFLIGNSRQVINYTFKERTDIQFKHICRFNYNWAHIYDKIMTLTGNKFDTLITSNYAHDNSISELKIFDLIDKVDKTFLICPNINHKYKINKDNALNYEEITDNEYNKINEILMKYNFPLYSKTPRTGLISIIYFVFIRKYKVYVYGFDIDGIDDPYNQHVQENQQIDLKSHCIKTESIILKKLIEDGYLFFY